MLLLTPTGSLPSPRWRWWARVAVAAPVVCPLVAVAAAPLRPRYESVGNPLDLRNLGGVPPVVSNLALAVTFAAVLVAAARWWCASAAPAASSASSFAGWPSPPAWWRC